MKSRPSSKHSAPSELKSRIVEYLSILAKILEGVLLAEETKFKRFVIGPTVFVVVDDADGVLRAV